MSNYCVLRYKPADLMRWEAALRRLGPEMVRLRFDELARPGAREDQAIPGLVAEAPHPPADFVERWLRGQSLRVTSMRTVLPPACVALVLAVLSFLAWWTVSGALQNPIMPTGTLPTINDAMSAHPPISQLNPPPGTTVPTTSTTTTTIHHDQHSHHRHDRWRAPDGGAERDIAIELNARRLGRLSA